jgi:hypothetical protein
MYVHVNPNFFSDYMNKMKIPNGLLELGYSKDDIPDLVKGAIPQVCRSEASFLPLGAPHVRVCLG